jgi:RNA 2',3'-cyclic 3'-phosphodiesterase
MAGNPATARLFLALWPDEAVRPALKIWRDAWIWPAGAAPVAADKLHVTLHFIGDQPSERLPVLMEGLAVPFSPFRVEFGRATVWHNGIAVLEPHCAPAELLLLQSDLGSVLLDLGITPEERTYRPHVTMARKAIKAMPPVDGPAVAWDVTSYALVQSSGGVYTVLKHYS